MVFMKSSLLIVVLAVLNVNAYFLQGIKPNGVIRQDPIVDPGKPFANHSHLVFGGNNFGPSVTTDILRAGTCTTVPIATDHSNYWVPQLYFQWKNGSFTSVNGNAVIYYLFDENANVTAFPDDFRMISGTHTLRDYDPDSFAQRAITQMCLDFDGVSKTYNHMTVDVVCESGTRSMINFPSCWDGKNLDSPDHKSHVAFPSGGPDSGTCSDPDFPVTLVRIFMEVYWGTNDFADVFDQAMFPHQPFAFAQGDRPGYGYHGDFYNGWEKGALQKAIDGCDCAIAAFGDPTCCGNEGVIDFRSTVPDCPLAHPSTEQVTGTLDELPGGNMVTGLIPRNDGEIYHNGTWELVVPLSQQPAPVVLPGSGSPAVVSTPSTVASSSVKTTSSSVKTSSTVQVASTAKASSTIKAITSTASVIKASSSPVSKPASSSPVLIVSVVSSSSVKPSPTPVSGGASSGANGNSGSSGGDSWSTGSSSGTASSSSSTSGQSSSNNESTVPNNSNSNSGSASSSQNAAASSSSSSSSDTWETSAAQSSQPSATPSPSKGSSSSGGGVADSSSQSSNTGSSSGNQAAAPAQNQGSASSGTSKSPQPILAPAPPQKTSSANTSSSTSRNADKCKNRHAPSSLEARAESLVVKRSALDSHHHRSKSFNRVRNTGDMQIQ